MISRALADDDAGGPERELYSIDGLVELLSLSRRTIWRLRSTGELPAVRIGGSTRWARETVLDFVARLNGV